MGKESQVSRVRKRKNGIDFIPSNVLSSLKLEQNISLKEDRRTMITLESIRNDHTSGATEIAIRCAEYLKEQALQVTGGNPDELISKMTHAGDRLKQFQPAMAPVFNSVNSILFPLRSLGETGATVEQLTDLVARAAQDFISKIKSSTDLLAKEGVALITNGQRILTYSSSTAVAAILKRAKTEGISFHVIVPESRPMYEGRHLTEDLNSVGISCTLIIDGAISTFIEQTDVVLVGADRITEKSVVNKIGSRGLALMASDLHIPLYCACETTKFLNSTFLPFVQNEMPAEEVWEKAPEHVQVRNIYFEEISLEFFSGIITERGILCGKEVNDLVTTEFR
jgi:translation initiation factor 2B subunit (eIF-2B alpha/beta/delta family)